MCIDWRKGERVREREREREMGQLPPVPAPNKNRTCNLGMCPDQESNPQPFAVQEDTPAN